jgi:radical SAM protein with 4Fe4S-binding SPASM domain
MCTNTLSVSWNGNLFDCDFNQMLELTNSSASKNIKDFNANELSKRTIVTSQHCYGCTAGTGSSCQGTVL